MTDQPPKPKPRRRRRLIACMLVLTATATAWWYWPGGDQRFVGTWALKPDPTGDLNVAPDQTLTFFSNGRGHGAARGQRVSLPWRVEGNQLVTGYVNPNGWSNIAIEWFIWIQQQLGSTVMLGESRYEIISVQPDEIVVRPVDLDSNLILRRVPE